MRTKASRGVVRPPTGLRRPTLRPAASARLSIAASVVVVALVWELGATHVVKQSLILVPLTAIAASFLELLAKGELQKHVFVSLQEFAAGFALAVAVGIAIGLAMGVNRLVRQVLDPWVSALYATPVIALAPLFILWLGIGLMSKIAVIFLVSVFPVIVNTAVGVQSTDRALREVARSFGASRWQTFVKVLLPFALPFVVAGIRLGIGRGLVGVVVGEMFGAKAGLGFLIILASQTFETAALYVAVLVLAISGFIAVELLKRAEHRLAPWRAAAHEQEA